MNRYAEQLWMTLFAKAPEITLFDFRQLQRPIKTTDRAEWQGSHTSFDFDEMIKPINSKTERRSRPQQLHAPPAIRSNTLTRCSANWQSNWYKSYKPYNSLGEDFLQNFLGMAGIPMDLVPNFLLMQK